jgi:O-antigen/teichoic acid export membrane protein
MIIKIINKLKLIYSNDSDIIKKLLKTFLTRGLAAIGTFIFNVFLVRVMGIEEYGVFMIAYSIIIGCGIFIKFGMPSAIMRFSSIMYKNNQFGKILKLKKDVTVFNLILSVIFSLIIIFNTNLISIYFFENQNVNNLLYIFALSLPFYSFLGVQSSFFKSFSRPEIAPFFEVGLMLFFTTISIYVYSFFDDNIVSSESSFFFLTSCLLTYFLGGLLLKKIIREKTSREIISHKKYTGFYSTLWSYAALDLSSYFLKFSPILILGYYFSGNEVGYYSISSNSAFLINFVLWIVSSVYAPHFANLFKEKKMKELDILLKKSTVYMLFIATPVFLIIVFFPSFIISIFDPHYKGSFVPIIVLAIAQLVNVATGPVLFLMNMIGKQKELMVIIFYTSFISIILGLILIPKYSYIGAAFATAIGLIIQNLVALSKAKKNINENYV